MRDSVIGRPLHAVVRLRLRAKRIHWKGECRPAAGLLLCGSMP